jgi:hypothetical protein
MVVRRAHTPTPQRSAPSDPDGHRISGSARAARILRGVSMRLTRSRSTLAAAAAAAVLATAGAMTTVTAHAATLGCAVSYSVPHHWPGGFTASVTVTNLGDPVTGWTLTWSYTAGQQVSPPGWNAVVSQTGAQVTARNADWNATLGTGASATFGFNASWNNTANPAPASFAFNGTTCTGAPVTPSPGPSSASPSPSVSPSGPGGTLPSSFQWSSSGILISPRTDPNHPIVSVKDPTVVRWNNRWIVYATTANTSGNWSLIYTSFTDWPQAATAPVYYLDQNPNIGTGYRAAPQLFFFAPQNRWFLVYQTGPPSYSTATDPTRPETWTAPRTFIASEPPIVTQNKGPGQWIDFWVICDSANCYLFFTDDNGHLYRAQTTVANFPNGFGNTQIVLSDSRFALFEGSAHYKLRGSNRYLTLIEGIDSQGRRWYRSWTASSLAGQWTPLAATENNPFARANNVTFPSGAWTRDISHGELIRTGVDQTLEIDPCNLRFLYQGMDPGASGPYSQLPWRLGLLTQTNSTC